MAISYSIGGIQQVGVGVDDLTTGWQWYRDQLGFDLPIFRDRGLATLMGHYTNGKSEEREAMLAINMVGGGGVEIWQYINRLPRTFSPPIAIGSPGIYGIRLKCTSLSAAHRFARQQRLNCSEIFELPHGQSNFALYDHLNNLYMVTAQPDLLQRRAHPIGGVCGAIIGCSDIEQALPIYSGLLGYDQVVYDYRAPLQYQPQLETLYRGTRPTAALGEPHMVRQLRLERSSPPRSPLAPLYGHSHLELWELCQAAKPPHIFARRQWGDIGFIHLCFEIGGLDDFRHHAAKSGVSFTVDSGTTFRMGEAGGRFAYIEDPDGTLIELVETHRITLSKRLAISINLQRPNRRSLPRPFFWLLSLGRKRGVRKS